jgi:3-hydroxy-3-methylglutaryl CoA synthase
MLIVHPDVLISATSVAGSYQCLRKSVLDATLSGGDSSIHMLLGTVLHEVFQLAISSAPLPPPPALIKAARRVLDDKREEVLKVAAARVSEKKKKKAAECESKKENDNGDGGAAMLVDAVESLQREVLQKVVATVPTMHQWAREFRGTQARAQVSPGMCVNSWYMRVNS